MIFGYTVADSLPVYILLFIVGLVFLIKGGDYFVDGATDIAHRFKIPEIIIGATIVSIGTTLPEVMVSATSAISGHGDMAYGNAIGSIICNTSLIAALTVAIAPSAVNKKALRGPVIFFFASATVYCVIAYTGYFPRWSGFLFLAVFIAYMLYTIKTGFVGEDSGEPEEEKKDGKENSLFWSIFSLVAGATIIAVGANLLVNNGQIIAKRIGVPESVIALTFVALGTSLPELITAIISLRKGHGSLSLGNIIGANLFNIVLVSGVSTALAPFAVPTEKTIGTLNASFVIDIPLMLAVMLILTIPSLITGKLKRWQGILLLCLYAGFCAFQFIG